MNTESKNFRPKLVPYARLRPEVPGSGFVLLYPEGFLQLNEAAYSVIQLCDGTRTIDAIATVLAEEFEAPLDTLRSDVDRVIKDLERRQLLES